MSPSQFTTPEYNFDAAKSGSSGNKTCLMVFGIIAGVCLLLCIGTGIFGYYYIASRFTDDPQKVREKTAAMLTIDIDPQLQPAFHMDIWLMNMSAFASDNDLDSLYIISMSAKSLEENEASMRAQIESQIRQSGSKDIPTLEVTQVGTRSLSIRGQDLEFKFNQAEEVESKTPYYAVSGIVDSNEDNRKVLILLQVRQSEFTEQEIIEMLGSIR